jgi:hypothetical protein
MSTTPKNSKKAEHNEKMIELRIRFWTNDIAETKGDIIPKHSWDGGMVYMQPNASHGIKRTRPRPFHTMLELSAVIEKVLHAHGVKLNLGKNSRKYIESE